MRKAKPWPEERGRFWKEKCDLYDDTLFFIFFVREGCCHVERKPDGVTGISKTGVKSDRPENLVFQSVRTGASMRNNNIPDAAYQASCAQTRPALDQLALLANLAGHLDGRSRRQPQRHARPDAALSNFDHEGHLCAVRAGVTTARTRQDVCDGGVPHIKTGRGEYRQYCYAAAVADGELAS